MDKIINIAQTLQQERLAEEQQWNSLHKNEKTKNKMLRQQLCQTKAMNLSLERENERLWKMIAREKAPKRKHVELVDLTLDEQKKEIKTEKPNIKIEMTEIEAKTDEEESSEPEPEPIIIPEPEPSEPIEVFETEVMKTVEGPEQEPGEEVVVEEEAVEEDEAEEEEEADEEPDQEPDEEAGEEEAGEEEEPEPDEEAGEEEAEEEEEPDEEAEKEEEEPDEEAEEEEAEEEKDEAIKEESKKEEPEEEEEEVFMVTIDGKSYFTTNEKNGMLYGVTSDGEVGEEVGYYENGEAGFYEE